MSLILTERRLNATGKRWVTLLRRELRQQGHYLTGNTSRSLVFKLIATPDGYSFQLEADAAVSVLEEGFPRGKTPNYAGILAWVQKRGLPRVASGRVSRSQNLAAMQAKIAGRVVKSIKDSGSPTSNSYQFSKNGERKGFISRTLGGTVIEDALNLKGLSEEVYETHVYNPIKTLLLK